MKKTHFSQNKKYVLNAQETVEKLSFGLYQIVKYEKEKKF